MSVLFQVFFLSVPVQTWFTSQYSRYPYINSYIMTLYKYNPLIPGLRNLLCSQHWNSMQPLNIPLQLEDPEQRGKKPASITSFWGLIGTFFGKKKTIAVILQTNFYSSFKKNLNNLCCFIEFYSLTAYILSDTSVCPHHFSQPKG